MAELSSSSSSQPQLLSSFQTLHRTALALNNESVSLMQQGAFSKAQTRSSQSLRVLEEMLTALPQAGDESSSASSEEESASCEEVPTEDESRTAKSLLAAIEIHVVEEGDFCELRSAVQYGGSSTVFFPVVLRDTTCHNDLASKSLHELVSRQYAAALLNRAILLRLLQQQREADSQPKLSPKLLQKMKQKGVTLPAEAQVDDDSSNNKPPKLLRLAKRLLNRASAILCAVAAETTAFKDHDMDDEDEDEDDISCNSKNRIELMLVSALVLNCLAVVLKDCRLSKKAKIATQASQSLQALLERDAAANDGTVDDEVPVAADDKTAASWRYANATTSVFAPVFISPAA